MDATTSECPRCSRPVTPGLRSCPGCGFDLVWDQAMVTTAAVDSGSFMTTANLSPIGARPADLLGQATSGEYEILGELGRGGMAAVFLAREINLDRKVAIKLISPSFLEGTEAVERFKREARTAASLSHPGVIPIYGVRETGQALFFVMKYVNGRTLASIIRSSGPLPVTLVRTVLVSVANALDYAHRNGVIHRDIKPGNIMVDVEGHVMVTDFGIAKVADAEGLTMTGRTIGTPAYMSPESCAGKPVTGASDQYALGVVGYELLAGRNPFLADTSVGIMYAHVHEAPQPIGELRPDCPPEMASAVMRMIHKDPDLRFPTLKEAAQAIQGNAGTDDMAIASLGALAASKGHPSDSSIPTPTPRRTPITTSSQVTTSNATRFWMIAAIVLLVASVAVAAVLLLRRGEAAPPSTVTPASLTEARVAAIAARARARASGFGPADLAPGDSVMAAGTAMADSGRVEEAAALYATATGLWESLKPAGSGAPAPAGTRPSQPQPQAALADSAPPETAGDSAAIARYYRELALAIQSRQVGAVTRLLPNLDRFAEDAWRRLLDDRNMEKIEANFVVTNLTRTENQVHARIVENLAITKGGRVNPRQRSYFAVLTLGPEGWRQIREEK